MIFTRWSTRLHKWLALIVGVQVLFWVGGGLVMTILPIGRVRSEHRVAEVAVQPVDPATALPLAQVIAGSGLNAVAAAELKTGPRGPVWKLTPVDGEPVVLSATTGRPLPALDDAEARRLAVRAYQGPGRPVKAEHLAEAPQETGREGPLWRVDFDDPERTSFYLSPTTGEVVSRRSEVWRFYDLMWRLHTMDWKTGENFNHPLIIGTAALTLVITLTGFVLLWVRFVPRRRRKTERRASSDRRQTPDPS